MTTYSVQRLALALACALALHGAHAETWTYRGHLQDAGRPAEGEYALKLQLYDAPSGGRAIGSAVVVPGIAVTNGSFATDVDFGATLANAPPLWLEVEVAAQKEGFAPLGTRQKFDAKSALAGVCWDTQGNAALAGDFLGTTNNEPLELKVNSARVARYEPGPVSPNVISGSPANAVAAGVRGATIGGGGLPSGDSDPDYSNENPNRVTGNYGTVAGGYANQAGDNSGTFNTGAIATVAGGSVNIASGLGSSVLGGSFNQASGTHSVIGGGSGDTASAAAATVSGGENNTASGFAATVTGGTNNCAGGAWSWAGGIGAKVRPGTNSAALGNGCTGVAPAGVNGDLGTFVWAGSQANDFVSTGPNQFLVRAGGGVGINTNTISSIADVVIKGRGGGNADLYLESGGGEVGYNFAGIGTSGSDTQLYIAKVNGTTLTDVARFNPAGAFQVFINTPISPTGGSWASASDARFKHDVRPLTGALDHLLELRGVTFEYNEHLPQGYGAPGRRTGFVAQQVETIFPEWVNLDANGYRLVAPNGFEALTVEALRELKAESAALRRENAALQREVESLRRQFAAGG